MHCAAQTTSWYIQSICFLTLIGDSESNTVPRSVLLRLQVQSQEVQPGTPGPAGPEREPGRHAGPRQHDHRGPETLPGTEDTTRAELPNNHTERTKQSVIQSEC